MNSIVARWAHFVGFSSVLVLVACSTPGTPSQSALEPAEAVSPPSQTAVATTTQGTESPPPTSTPPPVPVSPALEKLLALFRTLGYDGVGLEYEKEGTLVLLQRVFSDPEAQGRRLTLIYTGHQMSYDSRHESLTVGGTTDVNVILAYIKKQVPKRLPR